MDCLANRIGILGCGAPQGSPDPVLNVNSLPGISLENIAALTDYDQETFLGLWDDVKLRAMKKFEILVRAKMNQCYKLTRDQVKCLVCANKDLFDVALWYLHGTELMIERTSTDTLSRYTTIDLDKAEKLKEEFYREFQAAMEDAIGSINIAKSDCIDDCIDRPDIVNWVSQIP